MQQNWKFQRGDIFFTHFGASTGSEQCGDRPAVILQNDVGNYHSPTLIVATMTSKAEKKVNQPTHCLLENAGLNMPSVVQAEQIFTIDKSRALKYLGHLTPEEMRRVDDAVRISLALNPMGSIQQIEPIRRSTAVYAPPEVVDGKANPVKTVDPCLDNSPVLFNDFLMDWLKMMKSRVAITTYANYEIVITRRR